MPAPVILDSVTHLKPEHRGLAAYCASHGGSYAGAYAAKMGIGAVLLNDAGIGRDRAGLAGIVDLERLGVPAAALSHLTCRIGDGADGPARGIVSFANAQARALGVDAGLAAGEALARLAAARLVASPAPDVRLLDEARFEVPELSARGVRVIGMDSNGLVTADDAGHAIVTGSHGGLLGGQVATAVKHAVSAAIYNDADRGIDDAGLSRLPVLEARGIAGACVSAFSACIGDARSTLDDGVISALNEVARSRGGIIGQSCRAFVAEMVMSAEARRA